jgi:hypothetical protein
MDGERSNSDVMTISQAGMRKRAKLPWTVGLVEEPPTEGPKYRIEGSGDAGTYLYHRIYNDGAELFWHEQPNKFMVPLNDEAKAAVNRYHLVQKVRELRRQQADEIARTPGITTKKAKDLGEQADRLEVELTAIPERPQKRKPGRPPRNNEV